LITSGVNVPIRRSNPRSERADIETDIDLMRMTGSGFEAIHDPKELKNESGLVAMTRPLSFFVVVVGS
jgi:hypothetical protein